MTTTQTQTECSGCDNDLYDLTQRTWTHYDHDSGWAYDDGEIVSGSYCPDCIADIDRITQAQDELDSTWEEPTMEDWAYLASRLAVGLSHAFTNWKDVGHVTKRELRMLAERMGDDWQRKW